MGSTGSTGKGIISVTRSHILLMMIVAHVAACRVVHTHGHGSKEAHGRRVGGAAGKAFATRASLVAAIMV
jgi:hypothetical protein